MATGTVGVLGKQFVSALTVMDEREIAKGVVNVNDVASFCDFMKYLGAYSPTKVPGWYHHVNQENIPTGDTTGATIVGSGSAATLTGVTLTAASYGFFRKRDVVRLPNGKNAWVVSVTPSGGQDTLVLKSVDNTTLTLVAGNVIYWVGYAGTEADTNKLALRFGTDAIYNHIQQFQEVSTHTDIQMMSQVTAQAADGTMLYTRQDHFDKIDHLKLAISVAMFQSQISDAKYSDASPTLSDTYGAQTTRGLDQYISSYGSTQNLTTTGVLVAADINAREDLLLAKKTPKSFMVLGATRSFRPAGTYLKNLGSGGLTSVRMNVDGVDVNMMVETYTSQGNFRYKNVPVKMLDYGNIFPSTSVLGSSLYYIPEGRVSLKNGGTAPYMGMRYLETAGLPVKEGANAKWSNMILETHNGKLAPIPNGTQNIDQTSWDTWIGLDVLAAAHMLRERIIF